MPHHIDVINGAESASYRPRLSRETRRLLLTALVAMVTLWALARVRFPDRPPAASPVPPILEQLTGPPTFADLAARVGEIRTQLADSLVALPAAANAPGGGARVQRIVALRVRDDLAVIVTPPALRHANAAALGIVAEDHSSGVVLVQTQMNTRPQVPIFWSPRDLQQPRYVLAASASPTDISLHPAFIGSLTPMKTSQWPEAVWVLPSDVELAAGTLLFTEQGELVGVVAPCDAGLAVVPARVLLAAAERLIEAPPQTFAEVGVEVDTLTPQLASAAGAKAGVMVAWVDPAGLAASMLRIGDVIESVDDVPITSVEQWRVRAARVSVGDTLRLLVTRRGVQRPVTLAVPASTSDNGTVLGLSMGTVARVGTEVVRVAPGSAAESAGIVAGDVITAIGTLNAPSPAQVGAAFDRMDEGDITIVAIRRGGVHRVVALQR